MKMGYLKRILKAQRINMKYKFGDLVYHKPTSTIEDPTVLEIIDYCVKRKKYVCMFFTMSFPYEVLTIWLCDEQDLGCLTELDNTEYYLVDGKPLIQSNNIDYDYFEVYEPIGNEQIKIRNALKKRKPFDVPLKKNIDN